MNDTVSAILMAICICIFLASIAIWSALGGDIMDGEFHSIDILLLVAFVSVILIGILGMIGKD